MLLLKSLILTIIFLVLFSHSTKIFATPLLLALESQKALVIIQAKKTEVRSSPKAEARIDSETGHLQVAQKKFIAQRTKTGAGIIINPSGLIVTNFHTINGANTLGITMHDGKKLGATIVHMIPEYDLALIQIKPPYPLQPIYFADSNRVKLRDKVYHLGSSYLLKQTISGGLVTGLGKNKFKNSSLTGATELIQVNINIYKGDSGGALLNQAGQLIGIMVAKKKTKDRTAFAIPSNKIKKLYLNFIK